MNVYNSLLGFKVMLITTGMLDLWQVLYTDIVIARLILIMLKSADIEDSSVLLKFEIYLIINLSRGPPLMR